MLTDMAFKASREVIPAKIFKKADFDGDGLDDVIVGAPLHSKKVIYFLEEWNCIYQHIAHTFKQ